ncbi:MAG: CBS domain-containing protein [Fimbriimonadales bacterium]|nr:CBS domain-containing protein [Fimbriimonadales bacterium]
MRVLEFVDTHAPYLSETATLQDAVDKLDLYKATALPVLNEDGVVIGLVTERQVFNALFAEWQVAARQVPIPHLAPFRSYAHARKDSLITEWMMHDPPVLSEQAPVEEAVVTMLQHELDTLPVQGEGKFIGTIRLIDCCQAILETNLPD